ATDTQAISYSLKASTGDAAAFSINSSTGAVTLTGSPDFEARPSYNFTVVATDAAGNAAEQVVTLAVNNVDDTAPTFTSGATATATAVAENTATSTVVYTASATDTDFIAPNTASSVTYSLKANTGDVADFNINSSTGAVTFKASPNYESGKTSYRLTVIATDAAGNAAEQVVSLPVTDVNEPPVNTLASSSFAATTASALTISGVSVNDVDAGSNGIASVQLRVLHGTVSVSSVVSGGLAAGSAISGSGTATLTLTGSQSAINATLATLSYTSSAGYTGTDTLTVTSRDGGTSVRTDSDTVSITVSAPADSTAPTISSIALAGMDEKSGHNFAVLNADDSVDVAVTFSEDVVIDSTGGSPRVALMVGSSTVYATYDSSNASNTATKKFFRYTVQSGGTDTDGISIAANALDLNGATIKDTSANANAITSFTSAAVSDDADYKVDTTAPTLISATLIGTRITLHFSEAMSDYLTAHEIRYSLSDASTTVASSRMVSGNDVILTLNQAPAANATLTYVGPQMTTDTETGLQVRETRALRDLAGNEVAPFSNQALTAGVRLVLSPGAGVDNGATAAEATAAGGVILVSGVAGNSVELFFTDSQGGFVGVTGILLDGTGHGVVTLTSADLDAPNGGLHDGTVSVAAIASDADGNPIEEATTTFTLDRAAPSISTAATFSVAENSTAVATLAATDAITTSGLVWSLESGGTDNALFSINSSSGALRFNTAPNYEDAHASSYAVKVGIKDAAGNIQTQNITVNVTNVNEAPAVKANAPGSKTFVNGVSGTFNLSDVFQDEDAADATLTYSLSSGSLPAGLTLASGAISGTPSVDFTGSVTITANDSQGSSVPKTIQMKVVSKPKVSSIAVYDSDTGSMAEAGKQGATVSLDVTLSETVTFTGTPSSSNLVPSFTANGTALTSISFVNQTTNADGKTVLHFTATLPGGNASSVVLTGLTLSGGLRLTSSTSQLDVETSQTVSDSYTLDNTPPTLTITSNNSALKANQTATITFRFSEDPGSSFSWDGSMGDVVVAGGVLGALNSSTGSVRTATFTPVANSSGSASISVHSGTFTDTAGNDGTPGSTPGITFDTRIPTLTITSNTSMVRTGETATITFGFSEDPGSSFVFGDISVTGGGLGTLSGNGLTRYATFTPLPNTDSSNASISVAAGNYSNPGGNSGSAGSLSTLTVDTTDPTLTITSSKLALRANETATITFHFSEEPSGFDYSDISVSGGTLGTLDGSGAIRTAVFTPFANTHAGSASISVADGRFSDIAGNTGSGASTAVIPFDTTVPTLSITSDRAVLQANQTATITFSFSETPIGFDSNDISVGSGGTLGTLSGSGSTRYASFTPTANSDSSTVSIHVAQGSYTDAAGNGGGAGSTTLSVDTRAPSLVITSSASTLQADETATITFTFSETPSDFDSGDISCSSGALSNLTTIGSVRTATFTPTAHTDLSTVRISVAAGSYTDAAGNPGGAGNTASFTVDTQAPTLSITSSQAVVRTGETATICFTFSEEPTGFDANDILLTGGGTLGSLSGSGTVRTATFTPAANTDSSTVHIRVDAGSYTDATGNSGGAGSPPALRFDTQAPTLSVTSSSSALKAGETCTITFHFSEDPGSSFTWNGSAGDVIVTGGSLGALNSSTGSVRTATFTPTDNTDRGSASIRVVTGSYSDLAGNIGNNGNNGNNGESAPAIGFDTRRPALTSASVQGTTVTLTFDTDIDSTALADITENALYSLFSIATAPSGSSNYTTVGSQANPAFTALSVSGSTITLTLAASLADGDTARISYSAPAGDPATGVVQDLAGNDLASFANTPVITGPLILGFAVTDSTGNSAYGKGGDVVQVQVTFSDTVTLTAGKTYAVRVQVGSNTSDVLDANLDTMGGLPASNQYTFTGTLPATTGLTSNALQLSALSVPSGASIRNSSNQTLTQSTYLLSSNAYTVDNLAPNAPTLALVTGADSGVTGLVSLAEAIAASGVVTVTAESGSTLAVTFSDGTRSVVKTVTSTGTAVPVTLTSSDLGNGAATNQLHEGSISVSATASDAAGNTSTAATLGGGFTLDTIAPNAPSLALVTGAGSGITGDVSLPEALAASGVVTVQAVSGSRVEVTFSNGTSSVIKVLTGTGAAQPVTLSNADLGSASNQLLEGSISVSATATDAAGNTSTPALSTSFTLDAAALGIASLPATALDVSSEAATDLADLVFSKAGANASTAVLTLTVSATHGSVTGLTDVDATTPGIQLQGTAQQLGAEFASARFLANNLSAPVLNLALSDSAGNSVNHNYPLNLVDKTAPVLDLNGPDNGVHQVLSGPIGTGATAINLSGGTGDAAPYLDLPDVLLGNDLTLQAWVNFSAMADGQRVFDIGNGNTNNLILAVNANGSITVSIGGGEDVQDSTFHRIPLVAGQWYHLAMTVEGSYVNLFINGTRLPDLRLAATGFDTYPALTRSNTWVGRSNFGEANSNMQVRDVRVYDYARSVGQVSSDKNGTLADPTDPHLRLAYALDGRLQSSIPNQAPAKLVNSSTGDMPQPLASNAVLTEFNQVRSVQVRVSGVLDGAAEKLTVAGSSLAADGSVASGTVTLAANGATPASTWPWAYVAAAVAGTGTFTFTAAAAGVSSSAAQDLLQSLAYSDVSSTPTAGSRVFSITAT
ncbi:MAG: Ig-like domain-containing protein, partial [Rhodoferax sp.]|nr:Ig-like domain-containing protein [Rhodoferax sp.]